MSVNRFFAEVLHAPFKNPRWSWGAVDSINSWVFLRVWHDHIDGDQVRVSYEPRELNSNGFNERQSHLQMIREGVRGYGVVCHVKDKNASGARKISHFDRTPLLIFGEIVLRGEQAYATIVGRIEVEELEKQRNSESVVIQDLIEIERQAIAETEKAALARLRIGQGRFREDLLEYWGYRCAVTGSRTIHAIRASHIQPWRNSTPQQRLDRENGLPLTAGLDALFDAGLISFDDEGTILISRELRLDEHQFFAIQNASLRRKPTKRMADYLKYHREKIFRKNCQEPSTSVH